MSVCGQPQLCSMQCACAILPSVTGPTLQYFYTLSHNRHDFRGEGEVTLSKMRVLISSTTFVRYISHSKKNLARYQKCILVSMSSTRYSCPFLMKLEFFRVFFFFEKILNIKLHELRPVEPSCSMQAGGRA